MSEEASSEGARSTQLQKTIDAAARVTRRSPRNPQAWLGLIGMLDAAGRPDRAGAACDHALEYLPQNGLLRARRALCHLNSGEFGAALTTARAALSSPLDDAVALDMIGFVLAGCEDYGAALDAHTRASALAPDDPRLAFNLAVALRNTGAFRDAEAIYDRLIADDPRHWEAWKNRSDLRTQTPSDHHVLGLEAALVHASSDVSGQVMLHSALGKEQEDLGRHAEAFKHYHRSASLRRRTMDYAVEQDLARMVELRETFPALRQAEGCESAEPIFILGLPRTGSTLVERIIASHSAVFSAGELQNFGVVTARLAAARASAAPRPSPASTISLSADIQPADLGRAYVESTRPRTGHTPHFIDKMPTNFLYLGLIMRALPRARIVHLVRDPVDTCFAIYKTLFKRAYPYSYRLDELADYYAGYRRLMDHWRAIAPGRIIDLSYESLVEDPQARITGLLERLDLPLEEACFRFFDNPAPSGTASAAQARRPIYASSVGNWRRYADELEPLVERLRSHGVVCDAGVGAAAEGSPTRG